jgi:glycogen(starch) synthase
MRVLFWSDWFLPSIGGVEVFSGRLLPALAARGHDITVVAGHHRAGLPDVTDFSGVTVRRFLFHPLLAANDLERTAVTLAMIARLKRDLAPDIVHLNTLGPSILFHLRTQGRTPPVLLTMHSPVMPDATRPDTLYAQGLYSATWINCNSHAVRADLCRLAPDLCPRSSVTYYGMEPPHRAPTPLPADPVVLAYGRLVRDKGFDLGIRAFARVTRRFPQARLVIAGEGAAKEELERLAYDCRVSDAVEFRGAVAPHEVAALINTASVVVVPSRWDEPFGLVALEAALMGRPVVATRAGGLAEVVEHGITGFVVEKEDVVALADAVVHLFADPGAADRMGGTARRRALERFAWDACVDAYERLYQQVQSMEVCA